MTSASFDLGTGCVVLVPTYGAIVPECEAGLKELQRRGYHVWRVPGFSQIDLARSQLASDALRHGYKETMWIDADVQFDPDDIERLRMHDLPVVAGIYPKKGRRALAVQVAEGTDSIMFGTGGGLIEIQYAATGFLLVQSSVYVRMEKNLKLPVCNQKFGTPLVPYFQPLVQPTGPDDNLYLSEDYSFCERVRQCGFSVMADTTIRLWHHGSYAFSWEDAGEDRKRYTNYHFKVN